MLKMLQKLVAGDKDQVKPSILDIIDPKKDTAPMSFVKVKNVNLLKKWT